MNAFSKALRLLLLCALALSALGWATTAQAKQAFFTAQNDEQKEEKATITMLEEKQIGPELFFHIKNDTLHCVNNEFEAKLESKSKFLTVTPHWSDCTNKMGISVTVDVNQCHFTIELLTATTVYGATGGIKCANAKESITVTAVTCVVHIPEQTGLKEIYFGNLSGTPKTPKGWILGTLDVTNLTYTETDGFLCPFEGENHAATGKITGSLELKGFKYQEEEDHPTTTGKKTYLEGDFLKIHVTE
jgi:hypothetical protein